MLGASWRRAHLHRKTDRISTIARELDMPIALVRQIAADVLDEDGEIRESPRPDGDAPEQYVGYFVNENGEEAVYSYNGRTGEATISTGVTGESPHPVVNGEASGLTLTEAEQAWLRACWLATGAARRQPF
jgi:hypothetical protein